MCVYPGGVPYCACNIVYYLYLLQVCVCIIAHVTLYTISIHVSSDSPVVGSDEKDDDQFGQLFERFGAMKGVCCTAHVSMFYSPISSTSTCTQSTLAFLA